MRPVDSRASRIRDSWRCRLHRTRASAKTREVKRTSRIFLVIGSAVLVAVIVVIALVLLNGKTAGPTMTANDRAVVGTFKQMCTSCASGGNAQFLPKPGASYVISGENGLIQGGQDLAFLSIVGSPQEVNDLIAYTEKMNGSSECFVAGQTWLVTINAESGFALNASQGSNDIQSALGGRIISLNGGCEVSP